MEQKPSFSSFSGSPSYYGYAIDVYSEMIPYALGVFDKEGGASCERISNFIREQFNIFPSPSHFTRVSQYLESMTKTGFLLFDNGLYKFHPIRCADDLSAVLARLKSSMSSHPNQRVPMPAPTHTRNPLNVPTNVGPSNRGRGRPRKVPTSAVKVQLEPTVIVLDDEDDAAQNNVGDGPPVSPVPKKARRVGVKEEHVSKGKEPPRPTCKEVYDVISNIDGIDLVLENMINDEWQPCYRHELLHRLADMNEGFCESYRSLCAVELYLVSLALKSGIHSNSPSRATLPAARQFRAVQDPQHPSLINRHNRPGTIKSANPSSYLNNEDH
ncbi:hypothetical protein POM88_026395 [Heracleum sosnowskyi]|uniref:Uncharacterized protein n=1 Tax=Heracleum sosnowskyi TaxID=360622 RepID=A0AAD8MNH8_9APIA|nr:hypothetical protein POM88_026395 [Heracleum sosnowskyi]